MNPVKTLPDGARYFSEGVPAIICTARGDAWARGVERAKQAWPRVKDTPTEQCRREFGLVSVDGRKPTWRMELWVDITPEIRVFTGRSVPVALNDVIDLARGPWLRGAYQVDMEPDAKVYWDEVTTERTPIAVE